MQEDAAGKIKSNALFETLITTAVDGIIVIDERGNVEIYNAACERLFGYKDDEVIGRNVKMLMPSPYQREHDGYLSNYKQTGRKRIIGIGREVSGRRKDGSTFPMYLSVGEGEADGKKIFVGIIHDLTELHAEAGRREVSDRHLADIVGSSDDVILSMSLDGIVLSWNSAAERIFGYPAAQVVGESISLIIPPDRLSEEDEILRRIRAGERILNFETLRRRKDGTEIKVSLTVSPLHDETGAIVGASKIARDVTAQRRVEAEAAKLEAELLHVSRLSAMGQMTAAIAHELNQPLTAITNYINAAKRVLEAIGTSEIVTRAQAMMEKASSQTLRAGTIIRNLRDFVEKRESERASCDLNKIVEEAIAMTFLNAGDGRVRVEVDLDKTLGPVMVDRVQIQQVLLNLIRNSIEAMAQVEKRLLKVATSRDEPEFVGVTIADTGPGLPPQVLAQLFQPFVTTKASGMGMGLTICQSIIENHGGRIWLLTDVKEGTAFRVRLPLASRLRGQDE